MSKFSDLQIKASNTSIKIIYLDRNCISVRTSPDKGNRYLLDYRFRIRFRLEVEKFLLVVKFFLKQLELVVILWTYE